MGATFYDSLHRIGLRARERAKTVRESFYSKYRKIQKRHLLTFRLKLRETRHLLWGLSALLVSILVGQLAYEEAERFTLNQWMSSHRPSDSVGRLLAESLGFSVETGPKILNKISRALPDQSHQEQWLWISRDLNWLVIPLDASRASADQTPDPTGSITTFYLIALRFNPAQPPPSRPELDPLPRRWDELMSWAARAAEAKATGLLKRPTPVKKVTRAVTDPYSLSY